MKKTLLIVSALLLSVFAFAQKQLATLNHNGEITVFYGQSSLRAAYGAAVKGDIITLSPGTFYSVDITKAVTIRGAGMLPDTAAGTEPTTLINDYTITVEQDSVYSLYMEGIYNACSYVYYHRSYNHQFVKCYFNTILPSNTSSLMYFATYINCIIRTFKSCSNESNPTCAYHTHFVNSVILDLQNKNINNAILMNCIAKLGNYNGILQANIINSILYDDPTGSPEGNSYTSYYSIGIQTYTGYYANYFNYSGLSDHHLYNYRGMNTVFKTFTGSYSAGTTFELLDNVAATRLGDDGTQIGIYGGTMPFDPKVRNPLIKKCNVAKKSTVDGKLPVDIEVVSE